MFNTIQPSLTLYRYLTLTAAVFMLLPLPVMQYVGEEGLMALKSYEMFVRGDYLHPSILGAIWPHSPFWHWPVISISKLIGWQHVDIAIRLVSVMASWLTAIMAGFTAAWAFRERQEAGWLAALVFLSMGEISFWYGWLGYVDAMFGCFIFAAIATLWRAIEGRHFGRFALSLLFISLAFLTKNITAYALFGMSGLVLLWQLKRWSILKKPQFLLAGLLALAVPMFWQSFVVPAGANTATTSINDALRNFIGYGPLDYLKHWLTYPIIFLFRAMPISLFLLWLWLRRKHRFDIDKRLLLISMILLACLLPFWVSANGTPRYLIPLYGLVALLLTGLLLQLNPVRMRQGMLLIGLVVLLKIPYSLAILPYIKDWRPERDVKIVAEEIMHISADDPLLTRNDVSTGLAIAAYIDVWRQDKPPVTWYSGQTQGAYVLAEVETPSLGKLVKVWRLRGDHVYLYWHKGK